MKYHLVLRSHAVRPVDSLEWMSCSLFIPSHRTQQGLSTLSYDVEITRHEHLANYTFHDATDYDPPGLASFTLACPLCRPSMHPRQFNLASSGAPPFDSPCGPQSPAQVLQVSSTIPRKLVDTIRLHAVNARAVRSPPLETLPSFCRRDGFATPFQ